MNMNQIMKQAQAMQKKMADAQEELANKEYVGSAGGDMVKVIISGRGEMKSVNIDPSLFSEEDSEVVEDLIVAAFNDAKKKMDKDSEDSMSGMMGGMGLPPGFKMPF